MKKVINGKMYNTDTATEVGYYSNGLSTSDLYYVRETLYKKRTGEFFLYGEGGAGSTYSERIDVNNWCSGEVIKPLTEKEAQKWAEENLDADEYINIFGEVEE